MLSTKCNQAAIRKNCDNCSAEKNKIHFVLFLLNEKMVIYCIDHHLISILLGSILCNYRNNLPHKLNDWLEKLSVPFWVKNTFKNNDQF